MHWIHTHAHTQTRTRTRTHVRARARAHTHTHTHTNRISGQWDWRWWEFCRRFFGERDSSVVRAPDSWLKGRGFESLPCSLIVNFLCWLLFRYPFHPRVTAVVRKRSRSKDAKSAGGRLQLSTHTPYDVSGFAWNDMVHGCMVYTELFMWHQPCQRCKYTTSVDIQKRTIKI